MSHWLLPLVALGWPLYLGLFLISHLRVQRQTAGRAPENRVHRRRSSDVGMALQGLSVAVCFVFRATTPRTGVALAVAMLLAAAGGVLTWKALAHLGRQWRLQAVVTDDHELIMTGPYRWVRHPVYTGFLAEVAATALIVASPVAAVVAIALFIAGTETRVRAEDALLASHFPDVFPRYRRSVRAYLPLIH